MYPSSNVMMPTFPYIKFAYINFFISIKKIYLILTGTREIQVPAFKTSPMPLNHMGMNMSLFLNPHL